MKIIIQENEHIFKPQRGDFKLLKILFFRILRVQN